jgi:ABC-type multidrug transport system ATPase subunit
MIFASHTLAEVEQLAGRIAVLDSGRLLACDTLAGLLTTTGANTLEESLEILTRRATRETQ